MLYFVILWLYVFGYFTINIADTDTFFGKKNGDRMFILFWPVTVPVSIVYMWYIQL